MKRVSISNIIITIFFLIFFFGLGTAAFLYYLNTPSPSVPDVGRVFKIIKGESLNSIAGRLEHDQLIRSSLFLKILSRFNHSETYFKSGYFRIMPGSTTVDIHNLLIAGYQEQVRITFPEGWTLSKVAEHLGKKGIATKSEVLTAAGSEALLSEYGIPADTMEGYLFPDTYYFPEGYPAYAVLEQMVINFFERLKTIAPEYTQLDKQILHQKVIMASIVEREYRRPEEAPLIASVFYNRLKRNIGLESCATLQYIVTEIEEKPHPEYLTLEDKENGSPYNTYKWAGLPPGPISNPGLVALNAAFHPPETDYWYFLLKNPATGEHYFSANLQEHNWAKYYYLKRVGVGG